jgi:hypothetical protein
MHSLEEFAELESFINDRERRVTSGLKHSSLVTPSGTAEAMPFPEPFARLAAGR